MTTFEMFASFAAQCNLPLGLYAALGKSLIARSYIDRLGHRGPEAREHVIHGLIYICIGFAK